MNNKLTVREKKLINIAQFNILLLKFTSPIFERANLLKGVKKIKNLQNF